MRSKLFVPGSRPELFAKAMASAADGISFDLEDAVAESAKADARAQLASYLSQPPRASKQLVVRINAQDSMHYLADLEALVATHVQIINLPKAEDPDQILRLADTLQQLEQQAGRRVPLMILANIESPRGLRQAAAIAAAHPRVMGLQLGFADLLEPLGIDRHAVNVIQQIQLSVDNEVERSASVFRAISGGASPQNAYGLGDSAGSLPLENAIVPSISDCASGSLLRYSIYQSLLLAKIFSGDLNTVMDWSNKINKVVVVCLKHLMQEIQSFL